MLEKTTDLLPEEEILAAFVNEQQTRADARNKLRTYPDKLLGRNKVDYTKMAHEEAIRRDKLAEEKVSRGESASYQEAIEELMHLDEFKLKDRKTVITEENWKNLPTEAIYSKAENPKTDIPVFLMPGWGNTPQTSFRESIKILNDLGRDVLSMNLTRTMQILATGEEKHPIVEVQKAMALLKVLEEKNIEKTDLVLYSESAINGLIAASMEPQKIRKIIMAMPAGAIGKDSFGALTGRFSKELFAGAMNLIKHPVKRTIPSSKHMWDIIKYCTKNPILATKEAIAMANSDTSSIIKNLEDQGIEIEIVTTKNDPVFAPERIKKNNPEMIDKIHEIEGSHAEIVMDSKKVMTVVDKLLADDYRMSDDEKEEAQQNKENQSEIERIKNNL